MRKAVRPEGSHEMRALRVGAGLAATVAVLGAGTAAAMGFGGNQPTAPHRGSAPPATTEVRRQTLADSSKQSGTLGYGTEVTVSGKLRGTITWLPDSGAVVRRGEPIYRVDNLPVFLLYGALPAYRDLAPGVQGADVRQFETELRALGYTGFTVDDKYSASTATAVRKWQKANGLTETGVVESGRVVYAASEVRVATLKLTTGEAAQGAVLTYSATSRVVTVKLAVSDQRLARKDAKVSITMPDGKPVAGTIAHTATVIEPGSGSDAAKTKVEVTVAVADQAAVNGWDQATVSVLFTVTEHKDVLTVPVAALLALAEGGFGVQVVEGTGTRIVPVETGLFSGGRVEITGAGIDAGTVVGVPA
jgi:hypothetical protein